MTPRTYHAPAKLNLSLRVLGQRNDGFHEIDTLMVQLPGLSDLLEFQEAYQFSFTCDDPGVPSDERNLVVQAVKSFDAATSLTSSVSISLKKKIPHGAGLGGGSSDAATTLLAINAFHSFPLNPSELSRLAASLGSDVPFFLSRGASRCTGRGEIIQPVPPPPAFSVLLLKPNFSVPTADAYGKYQKSTEIPGVSYAPQFLDGVALVNDLERPVFEKYRYLAELKEWLRSRQEVRAALMSGSGSTVFAILHPPSDTATLVKSAHHEIDPHLWHWSGITGEDC
jgi:4-diphosphocytidyl-2-C-methyl-D-erythritol kinase